MVALWVVRWLALSALTLFAYVGVRVTFGWWTQDWKTAIVFAFTSAAFACALPLLIGWLQGRARP